MDYLRRAWLSVMRRKGKSFILFCVIFILGNVIAGAIAVQQSTQNVEKQMKATLGATATIVLDHEKIMKASQGGGVVIPPLSMEIINTIGARPDVEKFDYKIEGYLQVKALKMYTPPVQNGDISFGSSGMDMLTLQGTNLTEPLDFVEKKLHLTQGRYFSQQEITDGKYVAIISEKLAEANGLSVGDTLLVDGQITIPKADGSVETIKGTDYVLEIIGLFNPETLETKTENNQQENMSQLIFESELFNRLYLPNNTVKAINLSEFTLNKQLNPEAYQDMNESDLQYTTPQYMLTTPEAIEHFKREVQPLLPEFYKVSASTDAYDQVAGNMNKLGQIAKFVVVFAVITALIIISLVVVLFTRDRKHELGIYLSIGEHKSRVLLQIIVELLLIGTLAMMLSLVTGNILGKVISEALLSSDMLSQVNNAGQYVISSDINALRMNETDVLHAFEVQYTWSYMLSFLTTGIITILLSSMVPLVYILRLNPKKIMM